MTLNFARDVVDAAPRDRLAIVELARDGTRREWRFGEVSDEVGAVAARLAKLGLRPGTWCSPSSATGPSG